MSITKDSEAKMLHAINHLKEDFKHIRTGRANPGMLDNIMVDSYGVLTPLKKIANVTTPEPRQLLVTPFDPKNAPHIAKAIEKANIGMQPIVDGHGVRLNIPSMDMSQRKEMAKIAQKRREECKVSVRNARQDGNKAAKKAKADGDLPEDAVKKIEKDVQDLTDKYCTEADKLCKAKEDEILTV